MSVAPTNMTGTNHQSVNHSINRLYLERVNGSSLLLSMFLSGWENPLNDMNAGA